MWWKYVLQVHHSSSGNDFTIHSLVMEKKNRLNQIKQRCAAARDSGRLELQNCALDTKAVEEIVACLVDEDACIEHVNLSHTRWLCCSSTALVANSLGFLSQCLSRPSVAANLKSLNLSHSSLGSHAMARLLSGLRMGVKGQTDCGLEELRLRGLNFARPESLEVIETALDGFPGLQVLDCAFSRGFAGSRISAVVKTLTDHGKSSMLREVSFSSCFHDEQAAPVIAALCQYGHLETLLIDRNFLGDSSRRTLIQLLETSKTLRRLKFDFVGTLLSAGSVQPFADSLAASSVEVLEISLLIAEPRTMRQVLFALPASKRLQELSIDGVALPILASVLSRFASLRKLVIKGDFEWSAELQQAFYHNRSLQECIVLYDKFEMQDDLDAMTERNRAIARWERADQKQRAALLLLWPQLLSKRPMQTVLTASCCLDMLRRGVVEA
jgi:hypothetical protein